MVNRNLQLAEFRKEQMNLGDLTVRQHFVLKCETLLLSDTFKSECDMANCAFFSFKHLVKVFSRKCVKKIFNSYM